MKNKFKYQDVKNPTEAQLITRQNELSSDLLRTYNGNFQLIKKDVIDFSFEKLKLDSIAELGCTWGVDGAYGQYIADKYQPKNITMVDLNWNEEILYMCKKHKCIKTINDNFCTPSVSKQIGKVDAVIFFDLLLHFVNPDWNTVLSNYAKQTSCFMIVNPQYFGSETTIRLWDLDQETYFKTVPHNPEQKAYARMLKNPYEFDKSQQKVLRDAAYVWQWGITNHDLINVMDRLGFELIYLKQGNIKYGKLKVFLDYAFIFVKKSDLKNISK
ncbi:MAG: class I SAM-dependent methyltransferase [Gammaproteobacteria bacterium]|nr:class I SAM-dependent methyltransferase [Gammaproteobacteria bacterium]